MQPLSSETLWLFVARGCRTTPQTAMREHLSFEPSKEVGPKGVRTLAPRMAYRLNGCPTFIWFTPVIWIHVPASGCSSSPGLV
jgi:hypothetical protein